MGFKQFLKEFWLFGIKQAYACLFGGYLLALIIVTSYWYPFSMPRYDFLFFAAFIFQAFLLIFKFETPREALVILLFHLVATGMEVFKTSDAIGSWRYPEHFNIGFGNYPLFAGFMYSAVGSYIARAWRIFGLHYSHFPNRKSLLILASLIYINFFTHHYFIDIRWGLFLLSFILFRQTNVYYQIVKTPRSMPLLVGWLLVSLFIWFAENAATYSRIWIYPSQENGWHIVAISKLGAWFLLMMLSWILVSLIHKPVAVNHE